jgi:maleylacetate reductase
MPNRLHEVGVSRDQFDRVARNAMLDRWVHGNPRKLTSPDVLRILEDAA